MDIKERRREERNWGGKGSIFFYFFFGFTIAFLLSLSTKPDLVLTCLQSPGSLAFQKLKHTDLDLWGLKGLGEAQISSWVNPLIISVVVSSIFSLFCVHRFLRCEVRVVFEDSIVVRSPLSPRSPFLLPISKNHTQQTRNHFVWWSISQPTRPPPLT